MSSGKMKRAMRAENANSGVPKEEFLASILAEELAPEEPPVYSDEDNPGEDTRLQYRTETPQ